MNLHEAQTLSISLIKEHGLHDWKFAFNQRKRSLGLCSHTKKTIFLSTFFTSQLGKDEVLDTILHEIAHALVGCVNGHNHVWKAKAKQIGCRGERVAGKDKTKDVVIQGKYHGKCKGCGKTYVAHRRPKRSHWCKCTGRSFDPDMKLIYIQQY